MVDNGRRTGEIALIAVSTALATAAAQTTPTESKNNTMVFSTEDPAKSPRGAEMRQRLADPVEREKQRAENRRYLQDFYAELAEVTGIDAATEAKVFDILTDQQMNHLDEFWGAKSGPGRAPAAQDFYAPMRAQNAAANKAKQQLHDLLGDAGYDRYLDYKDSLVERQQVVYYNKQLDDANKLNASQKQKLMALMRARHDAEMEESRRGSRGLFGLEPSGRMSFSPQDMQKRNVELNEEAFRRMQRESREFLAQLPQILTPAQIASIEAVEAKKISAQRGHVQQMRVSAGMPAAFDESKQPPPPPQRTLIHGKVRLELRLTIDENAPVSIDVVTENGKPAPGFQAPEGLWAVPTPLLYEENWAYILVDFYEDRGGQRRRVQGGVNSGMRTDPALDSRPLEHMAGGVSSIDGRKMYSVVVNARVRPSD